MTVRCLWWDGDWCVLGHTIKWKSWSKIALRYWIFLSGRFACRNLLMWSPDFFSSKLLAIFRLTMLKISNVLFLVFCITSPLEHTNLKTKALTRLFLVFVSQHHYSIQTSKQKRRLGLGNVEVLPCINSMGI